jgi:hypothetical protein
MDIEKAYPATASLAKWRRTVTSAAETVTVTDSFATKTPVALTQTFMTVCRVDVSQPAKIVFTTGKGAKVVLQYGGDWRVETETMPLTTEDEQGLRLTWRNQSITRILLTHRSVVSSGRFQYVITILK